MEFALWIITGVIVLTVLRHNGLRRPGERSVTASGSGGHREGVRFNSAPRPSRDAGPPRAIVPLRCGRGKHAAPTIDMPQVQPSAYWSAKHARPKVRS